MYRQRAWNFCGANWRRMPAVWRLLLVLAAVGLPRTALPAATFTATLDSDTAVVGDSVTLTLKFEGGQPRAIPSPPSIPNLQFFDRGTSQNVTGINGQWTSSISETFEVVATQPGEYTIPALKVEIGGQVLASQPLKLKVVKAGDPGSGQAGAPNQLAFLRFVVPKKEAYLGEVLIVELQLFLNTGLANRDDLLDRYDAAARTLLNAEGFSILKTAVARRQTRVGNAAYVVSAFRVVATPVKTGDLNLSTATFTATVQIPVGSSFGFFQQLDNRRVGIPAFQETVHVLPLPKENVPPDFTGAVGTFSLAVRAGPTNTAVGEPITVDIQISGRGALDSLSLPAQTAWSQFKSYPPSAKIESSDPLGIEGTKTFEEIISPQIADIKALPPVSFSFFDPEQRSYRTLTVPAIPLTVRAGGPAAALVADGDRRGADNNPPPAPDIVPIKQHLGTVVPVSPPLVRQPWFLALQSVPALAFFGSVVWRRRNESLANNPRLRRQRKSARIIRDGLSNLRHFAAENRSDDFFAMVFHLLQERLGERLDLPASAITEAVVEERLRPGGVPESTLAELHDIFQACNLARYAPVKSSQELTAMIPKLESVLDNLQEVKS